jgi:hypothetical protein
MPSDPPIPLDKYLSGQTQQTGGAAASAPGGPPLDPNEYLAGKGTADYSNSWTNYLESVGSDFLEGVGQGAMGLGVGAGQLASDVLPSAVTDPIARSQAGQWMKRQALAPQASDASWSRMIGGLVGGGLPFLAAPEFELPGLAARVGPALGRALVQAAEGAGGGALQPTESGDLRSHGINAGIGAALGPLIGRIFGGNEAQRAMRQAGVRSTPGRMFGPVGRGYERILARTLGVNPAINYGRRIALQDFNRAGYNMVLRHLRQYGAARTPTEVGDRGLDQLETEITERMDALLRGTNLHMHTFWPAVERLFRQLQPDLSADQLRRFESAVENHVVPPLLHASQLNLAGAPNATAPIFGPNSLIRAVSQHVGANGRRPTLGGDRLAGKNGLFGRISRLRNKAWATYDKPGTQTDAALGDAYRQLQNLMLQHTGMAAAPGGVPLSRQGALAEFQNLQRAYAGYSGLKRAASHPKAEGLFDPETLLANKNLRRQDPAMHEFALNGRRGGVPTQVETRQEVGPLETFATGSSIGAAAHFLSPEALLTLAPAAAYNRPSMSLLNALANRARTLARAAGPAAPGVGRETGAETPVEVTPTQQWTPLPGQVEPGSSEFQKTYGTGEIQGGNP